MTILRTVAPLVVVVLTAVVVCASGVSPVIPIAVDVKENTDPAVAYSSVHDAYLVVWSSEQDVSSSDIWGRAITAEGASFPVFVVTAEAGEKLNHPDVAYGIQQDEYLVAYTDEVGSTIWARRVSWNGPGTTPRILIDPSSPGEYPAVAYNPQNDEFVVVYQSGNAIRAVLVTASTGALATVPYTLVAPPTADYAKRPDVVFDPIHGRYVVGYLYEDSAGASVLIRTVSADLTSVSPEFEITSRSVSIYPGDPAIAAGPDGLLVTWSYLLGLPGSVYARRAQFDGTPLGQAGGFVVLEGTMNLSKEIPVVCFDGEARYLVVWMSMNTTSWTGNIQGRYISATHDETIGSRFGIDTTLGDQGTPAVACSGAGYALAAMTDRADLAVDDFDVVGRLVSSRVFDDGFESGDCNQWSAVVGEVP